MLADEKVVCNEMSTKATKGVEKVMDKIRARRAQKVVVDPKNPIKATPNSDANVKPQVEEVEKVSQVVPKEVKKVSEDVLKLSDIPIGQSIEIKKEVAVENN